MTSWLLGFLPIGITSVPRLYIGQPARGIRGGRNARVGRAKQHG